MAAVAGVNRQSGGEEKGEDPARLQRQEHYLAIPLSTIELVVDCVPLFRMVR
jgi:hypothetical protein